jgi:hypothetical protein
MHPVSTAAGLSHWKGKKIDVNHSGIRALSLVDIDDWDSTFGLHWTLFADYSTY